MLICKLRFIGAGDSERRGVLGLCMEGEVGVTSQHGIVGCRSGERPALQSAGHPGTGEDAYRRQAAAAVDVGHTRAAVPEKRAGAPDIAALVRRAAEGDRWAWECLVDQYARLIWALTRDFKLGESDAADVFQATWLRLLEHIGRLEQPARVGSWLAATARNECLRSVAARKKVVLVHDDVTLKDGATHEPEIDERLLSEERAQAVRDALSRLPFRWRQLVEMLMADPPVPYTEISDQLGLPVGSIGPTRGRCLERLRVLLQVS
jgi:RNA polymerase sigma factor (sigma-70 family)